MDTAEDVFGEAVENMVIIPTTTGGTITTTPSPLPDLTKLFAELDILRAQAKMIQARAQAKMIQAQLDAAFDVGVIALVEDGSTPTADAFDDTNIGISAVTLLPPVDCINAADDGIVVTPLAEDGCMLTVNDIIDVGDNDIDDFDANLDGDRFVDVGAICHTAPSVDAGINCNEETERTPTVDFVDTIDVVVGVVHLEEGAFMPTAGDVYGATSLFDGDDCS